MRRAAPAHRPLATPVVRPVAHAAGPAPEPAGRFDWERSGITAHAGGTRGPLELLRLCGIRPGWRVLDLGCGTEYTACLLAARGVDVIANGSSPRGPGLGPAASRDGPEPSSGDPARRRRPRHSAGGRQARRRDRGSGLLLCDPRRAAAEIHRVLKPGGVFGGGERTALDPAGGRPLPELSRLVGREPWLPEESGWRRIHQDAGFVEVVSRTERVDPVRCQLDLFQTHGVWRVMIHPLRTIGRIAPVAARALVRKTLGAGVARPASGSPRPAVGYGLYVGRRPRGSAGATPGSP